jgi:hypothetical protein
LTAPETKYLQRLVDEAYSFISIYTGRDELPEALNVPLVRLAAILYKRRANRFALSAGNMLPDDLYADLNNWRVPMASRVQRRG